MATDTMKALVFNAPFDVTVEQMARPSIQQPTDVILKLTSSAICGSDLHMYDGHAELERGKILGHEPIGVVDEVGSAVTLIQVGDRVVVPFNIACGKCFNCVRGFTSACLTMNQENAGAAYGYSQMGPYSGAQAEYLRVPNGDFACLKLPGKPFDHFEEDFVLLADIFPTAYYAAQLAHVQPGSSVAIFGAGPVGLLAAHSASIMGAAEVYVVDKSKARLNVAKKYGAIPIDYSSGDPVEQITKMRKANVLLSDSLLPGEEKLLNGVDCGIDAVGYQAYDRQESDTFNPTQVLSDLARLVLPTGHIGVIGVYVPKDPAESDEHQKEGKLLLPFGEIWSKGITMGTGQTPVKQLHIYLRNLIIAGKAKPSTIISDKIDINDGPSYYREFDKRDKVVKAVIRFK